MIIPIKLITAIFLRSGRAEPWLDYGVSYLFGFYLKQLNVLARWHIVDYRGHRCFGNIQKCKVLLSNTRIAGCPTRRGSREGKASLVNTQLLPSSLHERSL